MSARQAPDRSGVIAQRLAEAAQIESEWNAMSYKDRAAWWMSAKWYGYQSAEAYRRGDDAQPNESCRYGEPGFFIATRVPYFEAQAAVAEVVAATTTVETPTPVSEPTTHPSPTEPVTEPVAELVAVPTVSADQAANILREAIKNSISETTTQPSNTNTAANHHKKRKKNKRGASTGAGKTIEISLSR